VNTAKRAAAFLTFTAMAARTALSWASPARLLANRWLKTSRLAGAFCRTTSASLTAGARRFANSNKGLNKSMNNRLTQRERRHLAAVKEMPCGVCGASGPSDAHHIEQGQQFLASRCVRTAIRKLPQRHPRSQGHLECHQENRNERPE
jgi:hypothetical protein